MSVKPGPGPYRQAEYATGLLSLGQPLLRVRSQVGLSVKLMGALFPHKEPVDGIAQVSVEAATDIPGVAFDLSQLE